MREFKVYVANPELWAALAADIHRVTFKEDRPASANTFDYVIFCANEDEIYAYSTIIEMDNETAYMQHGGAMPNIQGSVTVKRTYRALVEWLKARYKRISTRVENTNIRMLKLAMSEGLLIHGCDCYKGAEIFLHLNYGFDT